MKRILLTSFLMLLFSFGFSQSSTEEGSLNTQESKQPVPQNMLTDQRAFNSILKGEAWSPYLYNNIEPTSSNPIASSNQSSDGIVHCAAVEVHEMRMQKNPNLPSIAEFEAWMKEKIKERRAFQQTALLSGPQCDVMYIPYIVHVLHEGEAVNTVGNVVGLNISAAQVQSQMDMMNEAFRKVNFNRNDSPLWDDVAADFKIQFVPANVDETGNPLAEPGIDRVDLVAEGLPTDLNPSNLDGEVKPATYWDPERVFNIWIGELGGGLLGYAQFPSASGLPGMPVDGGAAETDGVVIATGSFQRAADDDGSFVDFNNSYDDGATTVHEVGHWIGLRHIWGDGGCGVDDFVEDTPTAGFATSGCPTDQNSCDDGAGDLRDMVENYMDYSNDNCMSLFTFGQKERADIVMNLSPRRGSLLNSDMADYPARQPYVLFEVEDLRKDLVETNDCGTFTDMVIRARMLECTDAPGTISVTVVADPASEATEGTDYEFTSGPSATLTGAGPEIVEIPIRIFNDGETEGVEDYIFNLELTDADGTDAVLHPSTDVDYTQAIWSVGDAVSESGEPFLNFTEETEEEFPSCVSGEMTLTLSLDNWPNETTWELLDDMGAVIESGGPYVNPDDDYTVLEFPFSLTEGSYTLAFYDAFGDGFSTDYGYELVTADGEVIVSSFGSDFSIEETTFCVGGQNNFAGLLPVNATVDEIVDCGDDYVEYMVAVNLAACVTGEQDFDVTLVVDPASTATEGVDFEFPSGNVVSFTGDGPQTVMLPIRFLADGEPESNETLILSLEPSVEGLAVLGENSTQEITIIDTDASQISISPSSATVRETDVYSCEEPTPNSFTLNGIIEGCSEFTEDLILTLVTADGTVATEGEDFAIIDGTHTVTTANQGDPFEFTVEVYNEYQSEGIEDIVFDIELSNEDAANVLTENVTVSILDALGNSEPTRVDIFNIDFENGLPEGWTILSVPDSPANTMVVSDATAMDGNALHVSSDGTAFEYVATPADFEYLMAVSPPFVLEGPEKLDFDFQVWGEAGFFGNFDFGYWGMLPAATDPTDPNAVISDALGAQLLLGSAEVSTFTDYMGVDVYNPATVFPDDVGLEQRMILAWASDFLIQNQPPAGYDNVNLFTEPDIEEEVAFPNQQPNYPMLAGSDTYFYNTEDGDIMMMLNSTVDNGCSTGYVDGAGTDAVPYISEFPSDWRSSKTFVAKPEIASEDDAVSVGLYYTEEEIAGWEAATGNSRENLYVFKQEGGFSSCYGTDLTLEIVFDNFETETSWDLTNVETGAIVASGGDYGGQTSITENISVAPGSYSFTIYDSFGDGICCTFGDGSYRLTDNNGNVVAEGGDFGDSETTAFCTSDVEEEVDDCRSYEDVEFAKATLEPFANGYKVMASFETGLWSETGFGISGIPVVTPAEFTAVQNNEQIDITFTNKYDESNIAYYIFESVYADIDDSQELETVTADGSGTYEITDFFPRPGVNTYSVTYVLNSGDKLKVCYTASAFYQVTEETKIYPNPATNEITLLISDDNITGDIFIAVFDEKGSIVKTQELTSTRAVTRLNMDISDLAAGTYYVKVTGGSGDQVTASFVKVDN